MLEQRFATEMSRNHIADCYLFLGGSPSRLRDIALQCASQLLECKGDILKHADCTIFDPKELGVDGLRVEHISQRNDKVQSLEKALRYRAVGAGYRAIILYDAERMTIDAQGALLKTTEEPPDKTVLFFTASNLSTLTPAFISRCRIWRVAQTAVADAEIRAAAAGLSDEQYQRLLQVYGNRDVVLELDVKQRQHVLKLITDFDRWLHKEIEIDSLLKFELGAKHAAKRESGLYDLSIIRALLANIELQDGLMTKQAQWLDATDEGIHLLQSQVSPDLVFQKMLQALAG
ncbi:MAG: hypothetical protein ACI84O_001580 [Myxococcota bacterium]|jgi:hypothetical protein